MCECDLCVGFKGFWLMNHNPIVDTISNGHSNMTSFPIENK